LWKEAAVEVQQLQRVLRESAQIRVGLNTAAYAALQLAIAQPETGFFIMGGDARTGRPIRQKITAAMLVQKETQ
jgi:hypothetical protein